MNQFSKILNEATAEQDRLGGVLSAPVIAALEKHRRNNGILGIVVMVAVLAGVVVTAYASLTHVRDPNSIKLVAGGLGLSLGAALLLLIRTWKAYNNAGLLLVLIEDAREDEVKALLQRLIQKT